MMPTLLAFLCTTSLVNRVSVVFTASFSIPLKRTCYIKPHVYCHDCNVKASYKTRFWSSSVLMKIDPVLLTVHFLTRISSSTFKQFYTELVVINMLMWQVICLPRSTSKYPRNWNFATLFKRNSCTLNNKVSKLNLIITATSSCHLH